MQINPPTTALRPLSIEGLPLPIAAAIAKLVSAAFDLGASTNSSGRYGVMRVQVADDACIATRRALVDVLLAEFQGASTDAKEALDALMLLEAKTDELVKHLQATQRLPSCFNLLALGVARIAIAKAKAAGTVQ